MLKTPKKKRAFNHYQLHKTPLASRVLTKLQKAGFRKTEPLYSVEVPALEKPFWGLIF